MNRAEHWGKKIIEADSSRDYKLVKSILDEAQKETKSIETTGDGVHLWLFSDGSVLRTTPEQNGEIGRVQWTK
jgi:hypothetical protein